MTFFFFVVGLEARREFDLGELRERRRVSRCRCSPALGGMALPVAIYLGVNAGDPSAHGWGVAMSTDTAFALGLLALVGPRFPDRLRAFMLTVAVVDDVVALAVIAIFYSEDLAISRAARRGRALRGDPRRSAACGIRAGGVYLRVLGAAAWVALLKSGVDPVVVGLADGAAHLRLPAARADLERATERFRAFPRAADAGARALGARGLRVDDLARTSACSSSSTPGRAT